MIRIKKSRLILIALLLASFLIYFRDEYFLFNKQLINHENNIERAFSDGKNNSLRIESSNIEQLTQTFDSARNEKYLIDINAKRINKLLKILQKNERNFSHIINGLGLLNLNNLIMGNFTNFEQLEPFLNVENGELNANQKFVDYLLNVSDKYSFEKPRVDFNKTKILFANEKPVIILAANRNYYEPLQAAVFQVHKYFSDHKLIIYDLGMDGDMIEKTKKKCKCELRKFDPNKVYSRTSKHFSNLKTFSWKPLIIQETLQNYESVIYMDTSVRLLSDEIGTVIDACKETGVLSQFIEMNLVCYTNPKMFDWFDEKRKTYENFQTIEANILMFSKASVFSQLIMRAWVGCALEKECIAPIGSSTLGCCGCHRYDQDALTLINSYFFGHPTQFKKYLPAYSFTTYESYFFQIRRYEGKKYFDYD